MTCREGGLDPGIRGSPHSAPPPAGEVGWVHASRSVPPQLTNAQTHLVFRAGSRRPAQRGSRGGGRHGGPAPILVGRRCAPRSGFAPTSRLEPGLAAPAGLPSRHPPGGPAPGGPWRLACIRSRSDRLGSPSWSDQLSHSAGPTLPRPPRIAAGTWPLPTHS